eukprot:jgi/Chlat1/3726/Chrsp259S03880
MAVSAELVDSVAAAKCTFKSLRQEVLVGLSEAASTFTTLSDSLVTVVKRQQAAERRARFQQAQVHHAVHNMQDLAPPLQVSLPEQAVAAAHGFEEDTAHSELVAPKWQTPLMVQQQYYQLRNQARQLEEQAEQKLQDLLGNQVHETAQLQQRVSSLQMELSSREAVIDALKLHLSQAQKRNSELQTACGRQHMQLDKLTKQLVSRQIDEESRNWRLDKCTHAVEVFRHTLPYQYQHLSTLSKDLCQLQQDFATCASDIWQLMASSMRTVVRSVRAINVQHRERYTDAEAHTRQLEAQLRSADEEQKQIVSQLTTQLNHAKQELGNAQAAAQAHISRLRCLEDEVKTYEIENEELKAAISTEAETFATLQSKYDDVCSELRKARDFTNSRLHEQVQQHEQDLQTRAEETQAVRTELQNAKDALRACEKSRESISRQLAIDKAVVMQSREKVAEMNVEIEQLSHQVEKLESEIAGKQDEVFALRRESCDKGERLIALQCRLTELEDLVEQQKSDARTAANRQQDLKRQLCACEEQLVRQKCLQEETAEALRKSEQRHHQQQALENTCSEQYEKISTLTRQLQDMRNTLALRQHALDQANAKVQQLAAAEDSQVFCVCMLQFWSGGEDQDASMPIGASQVSQKQAQHEAAVQEWQAKHQALDEELALAQAALLDKNQVLAHLQRQHQQLQTATDASQAKHSALEAAEVCQHQLAEVNAALRCREEELTRLTTELQARVQEVARLQEGKEKMRSSPAKYDHDQQEATSGKSWMDDLSDALLPASEPQQLQLAPVHFKPKKAGFKPLQLVPQLKQASADACDAAKLSFQGNAREVELFSARKKLKKAFMSPMFDFDSQDDARKGNIGNQSAGDNSNGSVQSDGVLLVDPEL